MTELDIKAAIEMVQREWPKSDWSPETAEEVVRRCKKHDVDLNQVRVGLVNLRLKTKWKALSQHEFLQLVATIAGEKLKTTGDDLERSRLDRLGDWLINNPEVLDTLVVRFLKDKPGSVQDIASSTLTSAGEKKESINREFLRRAETYCDRKYPEWRTNPGFRVSISPEYAKERKVLFSKWHKFLGELKKEAKVGK
jgi:hypothetical protein